MHPHGRARMPTDLRAGALQSRRQGSESRRDHRAPTGGRAAGVPPAAARLCRRSVPTYLCPQPASGGGNVGPALHVCLLGGIRPRRHSRRHMHVVTRAALGTCRSFKKCLVDQSGYGRKSNSFRNGIGFCAKFVPSVPTYWPDREIAQRTSDDRGAHFLQRRLQLQEMRAPELQHVFVGLVGRALWIIDERR